jgi:hypothetical protein
MLDEPLRMTELCGGQFQFATERHAAFPAAKRMNLLRSIGIYRHQAIFFDGGPDGKNGFWCVDGRHFNGRTDPFNRSLDAATLI